MQRRNVMVLAVLCLLTSSAWGEAPASDTLGPDSLGFSSQSARNEKNAAGAQKSKLAVEINQMEQLRYFPTLKCVSFRHQERLFVLQLSLLSPEPSTETGFLLMQEFRAAKRLLVQFRDQKIRDEFFLIDDFVFEY